MAKVRKVGKVKMGRPTVMTPETIRKIEEVFALGGSDLEACLYADISRQSLYEYQDKHPEFLDRKEKLKERPVLKARQTIIKSLDDPLNAKWYLERKRKKEFAERSELTGAEGKELIFMPSELAKKNDIPSNTKPSGQ